MHDIALPEYDVERRPEALVAIVNVLGAGERACWRASIPLSKHSTRSNHRREGRT